MTIEIDEVVQMDPDAVLPFAIEYSDWLTEESDSFDTGLTPSITVDPTGSLEVLSDPAPLYSGTQVVWWMQSGTAGTTYDVTVRITTAGGRVDDRTVGVAVVER